MEMSFTCYLGAPCGMNELRCNNEALSAKVLEQVSNNQELLNMTKFENESNEYQLRSVVQERISDLESWRWIFKDLAHRLEDIIHAVRHEHKALRVVVQRVTYEIDRYSEEASRPGALTPQTDPVEQAINEEHKFLKNQKRKFEKILKTLETDISSLEQTKNAIEESALEKEEAIHVDRQLPDRDVSSIILPSKGDKKRSLSPIEQWESKCNSLKRNGLSALSRALFIRQQIRGNRTLLSVAAQSYATRVDSLLHRRLYLNTRKLEDLKWQKQEAQKDYGCLSDELTCTEQSVIDNIAKVRLMEARLADRWKKPPTEQTKDHVDKKLKEELCRLKQCLKGLRSNIGRITSLQGDITASIAQMNCIEDDITQVVQLDKGRIWSRANFDEDSGANDFVNNSQIEESTIAKPRDSVPTGLSTIQEENEIEDEEDDYPFDF